MRPKYVARILAVGVAIAASSVACSANAQKQILTLHNGSEYEGLFTTIPEFSEKFAPGDGGLNAIAMVDDGLRRVFFNYHHIAQNVPAENPFQRIPIWQDLGAGQSMTWRDGNLVRAGPFNEMGHREVSTSGTAGGGTFVQAITEITPTYCRVVAIRDEGWEMRIATSTIPSDVLIKLLRRQINDPNSISKRLEIVDLLLQAKRYSDANSELKSVQTDFPDLTDEISAKRQILSQQFARQVLAEIRLRIENGQTAIGLAMTEKIKGPDVSAEILAEILSLEKGVLQSATDLESAKQLLRQQLDLLVKENKLGAEVTATVNLTVDEICNELNSNNLPRLATFVRLAADSEQTASQKIAFAISGWTIGSGAAVDNLALAVAMVEARRLVIEYLTTSELERRQSILVELGTLESGDPNYLAKIIEHMTPPLAPSTEVNLREPIELFVEIPGTPAEPQPRKIRYIVQLPPQYDPFRRYPCIVALHAEGQTPEAQLQWWAGAYNPQLEMAMGQATRHGYIVIAPQWSQAGERDFAFSANEHVAVLKSLRDALRRFAIDTDRVYLTGHFAGGDAAWDIGLCFPDLWAGVVPISAAAGPGGKYAYRCHETAANMNLAFCFVSGQFDLGRIVDNKLVWNKWLQGRDYDVTLVEYQGRLAETFAEELPHVFQWMARHKRIFAVEKFTGGTLRPWARQFWWLEADRIPPEDIVLPALWPPKEKILSANFSGKMLAQNKFVVSVPKGTSATMWLSRELVDFSKNIEISGRGNDFRGAVKPSRKVLLEDVRQRGDRQHPFWAKIVCEKSTWRSE